MTTPAKQPRLLDLFCGAGGAATGYANAGFEVVGVDIVAQPHYQFEFHRLDATAMVQDILEGCWHESSSKTVLTGMSSVCLGHFDAIHASPPCQVNSSLRHLWPDREHPDLIAETRELLVESGLPYVIENVPGAPLVDPVVLCGTMFGLGAAGRDLWRHRLFECSFPVGGVPECRHDGSPIGVYGTGAGGQHPRGFRASADEAREAMGMPWATKAECSQAVPPAYTEFIGRSLLRSLDRQPVERAA